MGRVAVVYFDGGLKAIVCDSIKLVQVHISFLFLKVDSIFGSYLRVRVPGISWDHMDVPPEWTEKFG